MAWQKTQIPQGDSGLIDAWVNTDTGETSLVDPSQLPNQPPPGSVLIKSGINEASLGLKGDLYKAPDGSYYVNGTKAPNVTDSMIPGLISGAATRQQQAITHNQADNTTGQLALAGFSGLGALGALGAAGAGGGLVTPQAASSLAANSGGFSLAPGATTLNGALEAAVGNAGNMSLVPGSLAPAANIPSFLPAASGALAGGAIGSLSSSPSVSTSGMMGVDQVGSDWSAGLSGTDNGGMLPVVQSGPNAGMTARNIAAGSGVLGSVNSGGLGSFVNNLVGGTGTIDPSGAASGLASLGKAAGAGLTASGSGGLLSGLAGVAGSLAPGLAALNYANSQPGFDPSKINDILSGFSGINTAASQGVLNNMQNTNTSSALQGVLSSMQNANTSAPLQGVLGNIQGANPNANSQGAMSALQSADPTAALRGTLSQAQGNAPGYVQASINPLLASQAAGYGDMLQSQAKRGIYGSSFGNNDIGNFLNTTGRGISDAGINAEQSALGLQANIGANIGNLTNTNLGQRANLAGQMDQNAYNNLGLQANAAGNIGTLQNSALASQANAAGNIGSLMNQNFATQGQIANQIPNTQISSLAAQGSIANQLGLLNVMQQNSKNNMYGRALGLFGNTLSSPNLNNTGGLFGGLSQIGSSLGSLLSGMGG